MTVQLNFMFHLNGWNKGLMWKILLHHTPENNVVSGGGSTIQSIHFSLIMFAPDLLFRPIEWTEMTHCHALGIFGDFGNFLSPFLHTSWHISVYLCQILLSSNHQEPPDMIPCLSPRAFAGDTAESLQSASANQRKVGHGGSLWLVESRRRAWRLGQQCHGCW